MIRLFRYLKRVRHEKREFNQMQERVKALPEDYRYVYHKIQSYVWGNSWRLGGDVDGMDMLPILADLLNLFETGVVEGKRVLDITGDDVAEFCDELLRNAKNSTVNWHEALNRDIRKQLGKGNGA